VTRRILVTWAGLTIAAFGVAGFSYGLRTTGNHALYAVCGLGVALSVAAALGLLIALMYGAIATARVKGLDSTRQQFCLQVWSIVGLVLVFDIWPAFNLVVLPAERATDFIILRVILVAGAILFFASFYWRFRSARILALPERSAEIRKRFEKWEGWLARLLYAGMVVSSSIRDTKQEIADGHAPTVMWTAAFLLLLVVAVVAVRVRRKVVRRGPSPVVWV